MKLLYPTERAKKFIEILSLYDKEYYTMKEFRIFNSLFKNISSISRVDNDTLFGNLYKSDSNYISMKNLIVKNHDLIESFKTKYRNSVLYYWRLYTNNDEFDNDIRKEIERYKNSNDRRNDLCFINLGGIL